MTTIKGTVIHNQLFDYFYNIDDKTFVGFVECFVYFKPNPNTEVSILLEKFLKDNELEVEYPKFVKDIIEPQTYFFRTSSSAHTIIEEIRTHLLSIAFTRFSKSLENKQEPQQNLTNKNFNHIKKQLIDVWSCFNENGVYYHSKSLDKKVRDRIKKLKNN